jgi:hypothetical protein
MSSQSHTFNAYESELAGPLLAGATSVALVSALGLEAPAYLVIDPDVPAKREWIRVTALNVNTIDNMDRGLEGSQGPGGTGVDHDSGATIRAIFTSQLQDDIFTDINALEQEDIDHVNDSNPHPVYLTQAEGDAQYLQLDGGNAPTADIPWGGNQLTNLGDAQADGDAVNRGQVLAADAAHVGAADPHVVYLLLSGGSMTGEIDMGNEKITSLGAPTLNSDGATKQYVDDEITSIPGGFSGDHDDLTNVVSDQHHVKYLDSDAVTAIGASGLYYNKTESQSLFYQEGLTLDLGLSDIQHVRNMSFFNDDNSQAGFIESFDGAGRQVLSIGAGVGPGQSNQTFIQIIGFSDSANQSIHFRKGAQSMGALSPLVTTFPPIFSNTASGQGAANVWVDASGNLYRLTDV